jgi:hypothetical protein
LPGKKISSIILLDERFTHGSNVKLLLGQFTEERVPPCHAMQPQLKILVIIINDRAQQRQQVLNFFRVALG